MLYTNTHAQVHLISYLFQFANATACRHDKIELPSAYNYTQVSAICEHMITHVHIS